MKKILVAFLLTCTICFGHDLTRTIVLNNGLTFDIKPEYHHDRFCVELTVRNGFARLMDGESYDIHSEDDKLSIKFYNEDFGRSFSAYKCTNTRVENVEILRMRYPAWVEDK